jgi:hypothetical protein
VAAPNGRIEAIAAFVRENPGKKSAEIFAALAEGKQLHSSLSVAMKRQLVFASGPPANRLYYPDAYSAMGNDDRLHREYAAQVKANEKAKKARHRKTQNERRKAERVARAPAPKPAPKPLTAPAVSVDGMTLAPGCKITKAAPFVDYRYAPDTGFKGQITQDWWERRFVESHKERT